MFMFSLIQFFSSYLVGVTLACQGGRIISDSSLPCYLKDWIIKKHNDWRSHVAMGLEKTQPPAQNMLEMCWDEHLASEAQRWANNCVFEHDEGRSHFHYYVGQNLFISKIYGYYPQIGIGPDFNRAINAWYNEVKLFGYDGRYKKETGHYSQLIWGDTYLVGCGYACFTNGSHFSKLYVCNYGPGGNYARPPYTSGFPNCHHHGLSPSIHYPGLCVSKSCLSTCH